MLVVAFALGGNVPAFAADPVSYVDRTADSSGKVTESAATCTDYTVVASESTSWSSGWYVVNSEVTIDSRVGVSGTVNLILCDEATLTINGGIQLTGSNSLTIYGQTGDTGTLTISGVADDNAGIGGDYQEAVGTITINGGTVNATGGSGGAGIGGGYQGAVGTITINGGTVNATGGSHGAGIGGGYQGAGGTTNIYGGTVNATGGSHGAGIGGGDSRAGGTTNIYGGTVNATGGSHGAGIGGGYKGAGGTTNIYGGTVNATGDYRGAGIGGGYKGAGGTTTINGGQVTATGGENGSGIGGGYDGEGGTITLGYTNKNDSITASSYSGDVTITDGKYFVDESSNYYGGTLADNHKSAAAGKTLTPTTDSTVHVINRSGDITVDKAATKSGETVTLSYSVPEGYQSAVYVNDETIEGNTFTMPNENVTVTATLTPITYTISYNLDGGTVETDNPATYTVETDSFTLTNPTKKYYTFAGWTGTGITEASTDVTIPTGSTGDRTYTATWTQHGFVPKDENTPEFVAYSMVLGGTLSVRYYVYLPDAYNSADCTIVFDVSGDTSLNPDPCTPTATTQSGDVTLYGYDCCINSAQMADEIHATLYYDNNSKTLDADTYSAEQYLNAVASNKDSYESYEVALIEAIRDYGHFVQPMLSKVNGWTIGEKYAYMHSDTTYSATSIDVVSGAVSEHKIVREPNTDIKQVLYSLTLGANTTINFYIYPAEGYTGGITVDDGLTLEKLSASQYRVRFPDIMAHELGDTKSFNITTDSGNFTVRASALCYVNTVLNLSESDETYNADTYADEVNAAVSLYKYYDATINYNNKGAE